MRIIKNAVTTDPNSKHGKHILFLTIERKMAIIGFWWILSIGKTIKWPKLYWIPIFRHTYSGPHTETQNDLCESGGLDRAARVDRSKSAE